MPGVRTHTPLLWSMRWVVDKDENLFRRRLLCTQGLDSWDVAALLLLLKAIPEIRRVFPARCADLRIQTAGRGTVYTTHSVLAERKREQIVAYGHDHRPRISNGPPSATSIWHRSIDRGARTKAIAIVGYGREGGAGFQQHLPGRARSGLRERPAACARGHCGLRRLDAVRD